MKLKKVIALPILSLFPFFAYANSITVNNNTNAYATVHVGTLCSSEAGSAGVGKPHEPMIIPQLILDKYCKNNCTVDVYMSDDCSKEKIATAFVDQHNGILNITNDNVDGYLVSGSKYLASIDGGPKNSFFDFLFRA